MKTYVLLGALFLGLVFEPDLVRQVPKPKNGELIDCHTLRPPVGEGGRGFLCPANQEVSLDKLVTIHEVAVSRIMEVIENFCQDFELRLEDLRKDVTNRELYRAWLDR